MILINMDINTGLARRWEGQRRIWNMARGIMPHYLATLFTVHERQSNALIAWTEKASQR